MKIAIKAIRRDFQDPDFLIPAKVHEIAAALQRGEAIPPVQVGANGEAYWLQDGFHRIEAALSIGREEIEAEIVSGTPADARALVASPALPVGVLAGMTAARPDQPGYGLPADAGWFSRKIAPYRQELLRQLRKEGK